MIPMGTARLLQPSAGRQTSPARIPTRRVKALSVVVDPTRSANATSAAGLVRALLFIHQVGSRICLRISSYPLGQGLCGVSPHLSRGTQVWLHCKIMAELRLSTLTHLKLPRRLVVVARKGASHIGAPRATPKELVLRQAVRRQVYQDRYQGCFPRAAVLCQAWLLYQA